MAEFLDTEEIKDRESASQNQDAADESKDERREENAKAVENLEAESEADNLNASIDAEADNASYTSEGEESAEKTILSDLAQLKNSFPELKDLTSIDSLNNPIRYAALRDLGLSPEEAYLATSRPRSGGRSHLTSSVPRTASAPASAMTKQEMQMAREIFSGLDDIEIQKLYKKVTN